MTHPMEPLVLEQDDPGQRGEAQGETWRDEIHELAQIRLELTLKRGKFVDHQQILDVAKLHLAVLQSTDTELHREFMGIARAADITPARLVVLNHYTDLRDIPPSELEPDAESDVEGADPGGCTAIYVHGAEGPVLAQTWDMHGSAEPYVRMIRIKPRSEVDRELLCFTLTGCLGMAGLAASGVAVTINNLTCTDAQVGLIWPAVVRRLLSMPDARSAHRSLMETRLSSGHHYMIADGNEFFGVETTGKLKILTQSGPRAAHIHTNHCFDPALRQRERVAPQSTTFERLNLATAIFGQQRPGTLPEVWGLLNSHEGYPRSICSHVDDDTGDPSASKTCGLLGMRLMGGDMAVGRGCTPFERALWLDLQRWHGLPKFEADP